MRRYLLATVSCVSLVLSGCAAIHDDLHHPGGYFGSVLDHHMFDASQSKQAQVLRMALLVAMVARSGTAYSHPDSESDTYASAIANAANELNYLAGDIYPEQGQGALRGACSIDATEPAAVAQPADGAAKPAAPAHESKPAEKPAAKPDDGRCKTFRVNFESDLPWMERKLFHLTVQALPQEQAKAFFDSLKGGNALGAAWKAAKLAMVAANGLHAAAAENRTAIEIEAGLQAKANANACYDDGKDSVAKAFVCLGINPATVFKASQTWHPADGDVPRGAFDALFANMQDSCRMVPLNTSATVLEADKTVSELRAERNKLCATITFNPRWRFKD